MFTCAHDYVSSQVSWLSIQSNGITAVVGPHTILTVLHTHLACDLCVCVQERSSSHHLGLKIRMEKEDLKIINRGLEDEMVYILFVSPSFFMLFSPLL